MKKLSSIIKNILYMSSIIVMVSCNRNAAKYENLETGENIHVIKDTETGQAVDSVSGKPVLFYVDLDTKDTIYGKNGMVVNNMLVKTPEGTYLFDEAKVKSDGDEWKAKSEGVKIKADGDEMKIKTDDEKIKIDGDEKKVKKED